MDGIAISSERIASAGTGVSEVGALLGRELTTMGDLLSQIRAGWQSDQAAPRFAAGMQGYLDEACVLKDTLVRSGSTLVSTGHRFAAAESDLAAGMPGAHR